MTKEQLKRGNELEALLAEKRVIMSSLVRVKNLKVAAVLRIGQFEIQITPEQVAEILHERQEILLGETIELEQEFRAL